MADCLLYNVILSAFSGAIGNHDHSFKQNQVDSKTIRFCLLPRSMLLATIAIASLHVGDYIYIESSRRGPFNYDLVYRIRISPPPPPVHVYWVPGTPADARTVPQRDACTSGGANQKDLGAGAVPPGTYCQTPQCHLVKRPRLRGLPD